MATMMFAATRAVFKSTVKKSTGIVGLDVVPNAREVLVGLYEKTLKDVQVRWCRAAFVGERGQPACTFAQLVCVCALLLLLDVWAPDHASRGAI